MWVDVFKVVLFHLFYLCSSVVKNLVSFVFVFLRVLRKLRVPK